MDCTSTIEHSDEANANDDDDESARRILIRRRCREIQRSELILLNSMYNVPDELQFATADGYSQLPLDALLSPCEDPPADDSDDEFLIDEFSLKLKDTTVGGGDDSSPIMVELTFRLSQYYPCSEGLSVYVRSPNLDGRSSRLLNCALRRYLTTGGDDDDQEDGGAAGGEPRIMDAINWIRENFQRFLVVAVSVVESSKNSTITSSTSSSAGSSNQFERIWLHSHHIYSKFKRKDIVTLAGQLDLSGFSMPGKPGVVCVEGRKEDCQEFWDTLRTWTWKRLVIRHRETFDDLAASTTDEEENLGGKSSSSSSMKKSSYRRFGPLKEVGFDVRHGGGREFHMDMAGFNKFLTEHHCGHLFPILFGLEATTTAAASVSSVPSHHQSL